MAFASELVQGGISAGTAAAMGGGYASVNAAGSVQGDGTVLSAGMNLVAGADGTKGVTIKAGQAGDELWVFNNAGSTLKVYPPVGAAISVAGTGVGSANAAFSQLTYKATLYKFFTSTQIVAITTA